MAILKYKLFYIYNIIKYINNKNNKKIISNQFKINYQLL